MADAM